MGGVAGAGRVKSAGGMSVCVRPLCFGCVGGGGGGFPSWCWWGECACCVCVEMTGLCVCVQLQWNICTSQVDPVIIAGITPDGRLLMCARVRTQS